CGARPWPVRAPSRHRQGIVKATKNAPSKRADFSNIPPYALFVKSMQESCPRRLLRCLLHGFRRLRNRPILPPWSVEEAQARSLLGGLDPVAYFEFGQDGGDVMVDGPHRAVQLV